MSFRTGPSVQARLASLVSPSPAMTIAGAWAMCPVPTASVMAAWAAMYQHAYDNAARAVRASYPGREILPSMN